MFNLMGMANSEQREQILKAQEVGRNIKYVIHTDDDENRIEITFNTDDPEAVEFLAQVSEGMVTAITQLLFQMFAMSGERI